MKPLVVNIIGGPGCGKSSMTASVFSFLKWHDVNCEMALEYAKEVVWSKTENLLKNQLFVFGQQHNRIYHLLDKVDVVITDSPLLLSIIYDSKRNLNLKSLVLDEFHKYNNMNYLLTRKKKYNPSGRLQTEEEAKEIDDKLRNLIKMYAIPCKEIAGVPENAQLIGKDVLKALTFKKYDLIPSSIPIMMSTE
jgi:ABC-type dipeptide/oligopeptide/nickel transport system ATPase component